MKWKRKMSNFTIFKDMIISYLEDNGITLSLFSNLHDTSFNGDPSKPRHVYTSIKDLDVLDMDLLAKNGYKVIKNAAGPNNIVNTADAFIINSNNEWYFIEFKDAPVKADNSGLKNNVLKKGYSNWYMILDILYDRYQKGKSYPFFSIDNPINFAKNHVCYILVCSEDKNPKIYQQIKNCDLIGEKYTPPFMERLKDYMFKEAYVYTETYFEKKFVDKFTY